MIQRASIFFILVCASIIPVSAQLSSGGTFSVDKVKGCAPMDVTITLTNPAACSGTPCQVAFDYDGKVTSFKPFTPTNNYQNPGTYVIVLLIGTTNPTLDQITIEVLPDVQPTFDIYICDGATNTVTVKITDTTYDLYTINYSDGFWIQVLSGPGATNTHSFPSPGAKTISVRGQKNGAADNCTPMVQNFTIPPNLNDGFISTLTVLPGGTDIQLDFNNSQFVLYKLEIATNSTTFQPFRDIYNLSTVTLSNLRADNNYYCFRLATFDPCTGSVIGYSNVICSADFDVTAQNGFNAIDWRTTSTGIANYVITKNDATTSFPSFNEVPPTTIKNDASVICSIEYFYQMTSNYGNGSKAISMQKSATAFSTTRPTAVQNITTIVDQNKVNLEWDQDPLFMPADYAIYKSTPGLTTLFARSITTNYTDDNYNTELSTCYQISYKDICGNESDYSLTACPIQLLAAVTGNENVIDLTWNDYTGWTNGVDHYEVHKYDGQGQLIGTLEPTSPPLEGKVMLTDDVIDTVNQVNVYVVHAVPKDDGINNSISNVVTVIKNPNLFSPDVFRPGSGDPRNRVFNVKGHYIQEFELNIFNRWGELIFSTTDRYEGWNGTYHGDMMPETTYAFIARITDSVGKKHEWSGAVLLMK
jgi:gliding motility-associated-like protein